ncbi:hypothetical protein [Streptomyces sp.]|uniref:hypothetical protein n=1 Tax=Streptomyces sp. TaxID=1931 RepID=UPI002F9568DF
MVRTPPTCPQCPTRPMLWKDTEHMRSDAPDRWRWYCSGCERYWEPTATQKREYSYGTP